MSAASLQDAIAHLIRLPESYRGEDFHDFAARHNLTALERRQLHDLASDDQVRKFGRIMRGARFDGMLRQLKLLPSFVNSLDLEEICIQHFEPQAVAVGAREYSVRFMEFLMRDERVERRLAGQYPEFLTDVIRYEHAQLLFRRQLLDTTTPLRSQSLLNHLCYVVLDLRFDVPKIMHSVSQVERTTIADHAPEERPHYLLMIGDLQIPKYRAFEIDAELATFLEREKDIHIGNRAVESRCKRPDSFADLVELGLCRNVINH